MQPVLQCYIHGLVLHRNGTAQDSFEKLQLILQLCKELEILTTPQRLGSLLIVPLLSWHHSSWDTEPDIRGVPHVSALSIADYGACIWPHNGPGTCCTCLGLLLGTEAPIMMPNSVDCSFLSFLPSLCCLDSCMLVMPHFKSVMLRLAGRYCDHMVACFSKQAVELLIEYCWLLACIHATWTLLL